MILLFISLLLPIILICFFHKTRKTIKKTAPPGPPGLPLIGNLHQLATASNRHVYLWKLSKKYGSIIQMKLGPTPLIVVSTARLAKEVFKTQDLAFCQRPTSLGMRKLSYNCNDIMFSPYNHYWREVRKITVTHLVSVRKVQSFRHIREDEISRMVAKIADSAASHHVVNLSDLTLALGSSLISRIAFGKRYEEGSWERRRFDGLIHEVQEIAVSFFVSDYFPAFSWVDKLTGMTAKVDTVFEKLESFYQELIDEHIDPNRVRTTGVEDDILDTLIRLKQDQNYSSIDLTWDNIKALLMNIFIAGTDASSAAVVWTMTALIKSPSSMRKVKEEIRNLIGEKGKVDEDDLPKLPYLKAVINEAFRMYPTAPLLVPRQTIERCFLDGYEIQPKTVLYVNSWAISRDPEIWENPDEFMPERFLNSSIDVKGQDFELTPFGSGRRMCAGISMGLLNVEIVLANLLYHFDWELPAGIRAEDVDTDGLPGLAVQKKNALVLVPKQYRC